MNAARCTLYKDNLNCTRKVQYRLYGCCTVHTEIVLYRLYGGGMYTQKQYFTGLYGECMYSAEAVSYRLLREVVGSYRNDTVRMETLRHIQK